ncbi:MAG: hypothetical protein AAGC95_13440 [Pseudomonadota bacterium]
MGTAPKVSWKLIVRDAKHSLYVGFPEALFNLARARSHFFDAQTHSKFLFDAQFITVSRDTRRTVPVFVKALQVKKLQHENHLQQCSRLIGLARAAAFQSVHRIAPIGIERMAIHEKIGSRSTIDSVFTRAGKDAAIPFFAINNINVLFAKQEITTMNNITAT